MNNIDNLISEFNSNVDKELEMQKDINLFAAEIAKMLIKKIDDEREGVTAGFYDTVFKFLLLTSPNPYNKLFFKIKMLDMQKVATHQKLNTMDVLTAERADFEHDASETLENEVRSVIALLLLKHYGFSIKPFEEEEEDVQIRL